MKSHFESSGAGDYTFIFDCIFDGSETVINSILCLNDSVFIRAFNQNRNRQRIFSILRRKYTFLHPMCVRIPDRRNPKQSGFKSSNEFIGNPPQARVSLSIFRRLALLRATMPARARLSNENRIDSLLVYHHKNSFSGSEPQTLILQFNYFSHSVVDELSLCVYQSFSFFSRLIEESGVNCTSHQTFAYN